MDLDLDELFAVDWSTSHDSSPDLDQLDTFNFNLDLDLDLDLEAFIAFDQSLLDQPISRVFSSAPLGSPAYPLTIGPTIPQPYPAIAPLPDHIESCSSEETSGISFGSFAANTPATYETATQSSQLPKDTPGGLPRAGDKRVARDPISTQGGAFITFSLNNRPLRAHKKRRTSERRRQEIREVRLVGSCMQCRLDKRSVRCYVSIALP
jgi:hypothetical protein